MWYNRRTKWNLFRGRSDLFICCTFSNQQKLSNNKRGKSRQNYCRPGPFLLTGGPNKVGKRAGGAFEQVLGLGAGSILEFSTRVFWAGFAKVDFGQSLNDFSSRLRILSLLASVSTVVSSSIFDLFLLFLFFFSNFLTLVYSLRNMFTWVENICAIISSSTSERRKKQNKQTNKYWSKIKIKPSHHLDNNHQLE